MSSRVNISILLGILLALATAVSAQNAGKTKGSNAGPANKQASQKGIVDTTTIKPSYLPTGVRIGTDLISLLRPSFDDSFKGWEFNADIDFYRYFLAVDYGHWERTWASEEEKAVYANNGNYWRVGADVNFLKKDPDRNMFFLGLRYARSTFSEQMAVATYDPVFGSTTQLLNNNNLPASWVELTTGLRVKIWKIFWLGYTARLKFGLNFPDTNDLAPSDVPGYGRADKDSYWGFNYQLFIRIPTRKTPPLPTFKQ